MPQGGLINKSRKGAGLVSDHHSPTVVCQAFFPESGVSPAFPHMLKAKWYEAVEKVFGQVESGGHVVALT